MSENRPDNTSGPGGWDNAAWQPRPEGTNVGGTAPDAGPPSPFSRPGTEGHEGVDPAPAPASDPGAPQSWPGYPPSAPESTYRPLGEGPAQPGATPYGSPLPPDHGYGQPQAGYGSVGAYGSNPYDQAPNPYQPGYGGYSPYGVAPVQHPKATPALVFGIIGLVLSFSCGIGGLLGIGGIINGRRAKQEIDADPQRYLGRGLASAGFWLGLAGVVIGTLVVVIFIVAGLSGAFDS